MNWQKTNNGLTRTIGFKDQTELAQFVLRIAELSDNINHHADMDIRYNQLNIAIITHDAGGITEKDFDLANRIDELYSNVASDS